MMGNGEKRRERVQVTGQVARLDGRELSYGEFWAQFMNANKPVVLTGLMDSWRARREWVLENGGPDLAYLAAHFGASQVQVADCGRREFTDQKRCDMTVADFVAYWQALQHADEPPAAAVDECESAAAKRSLYLKDWHFVKEYPDYHAYATPEFFEDDWLNWYLDQNQMHASGEEEEEGEVQGSDARSDYRFVYMGPKGTWTPLHADVLRSYSWSSNVCGRKLWHLLPAEQMPLIYDRHKRNTVYDIYGDVSTHLFPDFHKTRWLECEQGPGEIIFVPSGWFHQVTNMEDTISINHNWLNACNLHWNWKMLLSDYRETVESIEDIRDVAEDFEGLCQRNLAANSGMNFADYYRFLVAVAQQDVDGDETDAGEVCPVSAVSARQKAFNLQRIRNTVAEMLTQAYFLHISNHDGAKRVGKLRDPEAVIASIDRALEKLSARLPTTQTRH